MTLTRPPLFAVAQRYSRLGLSVIPADHTTKRPAGRLLPRSDDDKPTWKPFQTTAADADQLAAWFDRPDVKSLAIVCGKVSGGYFVIDFDNAAERLYSAFSARAGEIVPEPLVILTGSGGGRRHYCVRTETPPGNLKLAWVPDAQAESGRAEAIETRGEGGYVLAPPSLHPSGNAYEIEEGSFDAIPCVSADQLNALLDIARSLDECPLAKNQIDAVYREHTNRSAASRNGQGSVVEQFNQRHDCRSMLLANGYRESSQGRDWLWRPGKSSGSGSVLLRDGKSAHFSSNDALNDGRFGNGVCGIHDPFDLYVAFNHRGDFKAAVKAAARAMDIGYAKPPEPSRRNESAPMQLSAAESANEVVFPEPVPLKQPDPPELPRGLLPPVFEQFASEVANAVEVPFEFSAVHALAAIATVAQGKFSVSPEHGYFEPVNLYVAAALVSGSRKSAVQNYFRKPHIDWEREKEIEHRDAVKKATALRHVMDAKAKAARAKAERAEASELDEAMKAVHELEDQIPEIPVRPRLTTSDCTPEHLGTMMSEQGGRMAVWSDEGGFFDTIGGRYSNGVANLDLILQSHSGTRVEQDRGSRASVIINHPYLTICVSPQPSVLQELGSKPGFRSRGLIARFVFVCPTSNLGQRLLEPCPVTDKTENDYRDFITRVLNMPMRTDAHDRPIPYVLKPSTEAYRLWKDYQHEVESFMRPRGKLDGLTDVGGKWPGQTLRIAGLMHIGAYASVLDSHHTIDVDTMRKAIAFAQTCLEHSLHVLGEMGVDDSLEIARRLWDEAMKIDAPAVTARELWNPTRGKYPKMADVEKGFEALIERGWLVEQADDGRRTRGRPTRKFLINPKATSISAHFAHSAQGNQRGARAAG